MNRIDLTNVLTKDLKLDKRKVKPVLEELSEKERLRERRKRLLELHHKGNPGTISDLAREFGVTEQALYNDWTARDSWLSDIVDLKDMKALSARIIAEYEAIVAECWSSIEQIRTNEAWHSYNGAVKNLTEAVTRMSELLQSMGCLPKVAAEIRVESRTEEAKLEMPPMSKEDAEILIRAEHILADAEQKRNQKDPSFHKLH